MAILAIMAIMPGDFPKYDASTLPITARIHIGGDPDWLAVGLGSVWVSVPTNNEIVRINPTNNTIQARIPVDKEPCYGMGIGRTRLWVLNCKSQTLTRLNPRSGRVDLRIPVSIDPEGEGSIAISPRGVWFVGNDDRQAGTLIEVDLARGRTLRRIAVGKRSAVVNLGFGSIWVTSSAENKIYRVNPKNGKITAQVEVAAAPRFTAVGGDSLWVLSQSDGSVTRIDPNTNKVASVTRAGVPGAGGDISVGGAWIWVAAAGTPLTRVYAASARVADQYGNYPGADAIRFGFGSVWISDHRKGDLWRIDPAKLPVY